MLTCFHNRHSGIWLNTCFPCINSNGSMNLHILASTSQENADDWGNWTALTGWRAAKKSRWERWDTIHGSGVCYRWRALIQCHWHLTQAQNQGTDVKQFLETHAEERVVLEWMWVVLLLISVFSSGSGEVGTSTGWFKQEVPADQKLTVINT